MPAEQLLSAAAAGVLRFGATSGRVVEHDEVNER